MGGGEWEEGGTYHFRSGCVKQLESLFRLSKLGQGSFASGLWLKTDSMSHS